MQPPVVEVLNEAGRSPYVLVCEHAAKTLPPGYGTLGLGQADLSRHIGWDIGAAAVARALSALIDAPLVLAGYSRLLIDLNRPPGSATSIPAISEATLIPGNQGLSAAEAQHRIDSYFTPFHSRLAGIMAARQAARRPTALIAVHSFTPVFLGVARPWAAGILYRRSQRFGAALVAALGGEGAAVAHNQPYQIDDGSDYTVPVHGEALGLEAVLVEISQGLLADRQGTDDWASRLAGALAAFQALI
jgi:predicted N-formylglutamate amidohydrolase